jgi:hypothetical protein
MELDDWTGVDVCTGDADCAEVDDCRGMDCPGVDDCTE